MSGETFLCEVCGLLIDWEYVDLGVNSTNEIRWFYRSQGYKYHSAQKPSPHNHVPRLEKVVK